MGLIRKYLRPLVNRCGFDVVRYQKYPYDFSERHIRIWEAVQPFTMTNPIRVKVLIDAVEYLVNNKINGAMVECGLWKGGSTMAMALALKELGDVGREFYLYDTFAGMTAPTEADVSFAGEPAGEMFESTKTSEDSSNWCYSPLEEVKQNVLSTGYPDSRIRFVQGKVEETIPGCVPDEIALLRLDTDWYESTKHEMEHLFPRLANNGILIIDDYGGWDGAKRAVDEYLRDKEIRMFLGRVDFDSRIAVKTREA